MTTKTFRNTLPAITLLAALACAATPARSADKEEDHSAHHPQAPASTAPAPSNSGPAPANAMDRQMQAMTAMHEKMMHAKTPEERRALMAEHMKTLREGMGMMQKMGKPGHMTGMAPKQEPVAMPCDLHARQQMLEKRVDMMESMMQMMVDRLADTAPR